MPRMSTCALLPYTCVVKCDIKSAVQCLLYLRTVWIAVRPRRGEATLWENIFLPGEVQYSQVTLIEMFLYIFIDRVDS